MRAEEKIYQWLINDDALNAIVESRIEPAIRTQAQTMPSVTYRRTGTTPAVGMDGDHGFALVVVEVEVQSESWIQAREIARLIRRCLKQNAVILTADDDVDEERTPVTYYYTIEYQVSEKEDIA